MPGEASDWLCATLFAHMPVAVLYAQEEEAT